MTDILDAAYDEHQPAHVFALFSGGHDSVCSLRVAMEHPRFTAAVYIDTGTGIPETRDYARDTARVLGVRLLEYSTPRSEYEAMVLKHGFPGPAQHSIMYRRLKERRVDELVREFKQRPRDRIMLVTGVRRQESTRRMGTTVPVKRDGATVWVAPIIDWAAADRLPFMERHGIEPSPVVQRIHRSGECNCGAYGSPRELDEMRFWGFNEIPDWLFDLERQVFAVKPNACRWGMAPQMPTPEGQQAMFLCQSCPTRWESAA